MNVTYDRSTVRTRVQSIDPEWSEKSRTAQAGEVDGAAVEPWDDSIHSAPPRIDGVSLGIFIGFDESGRALVDFAMNPSGKPHEARVVFAGDLNPGASVALMFEAGDPWKPIVIGPIRDDALVSPAQAPAVEVEVEKDEETLALTAKKQIVLRCGKASITLTRSGKILLRGNYILSRSSGVNAMKGGSVHIN